MLVKQNSRAFALEITPESSPLKLAYFQATGRWWILHCTSHNLPKPSGVGNSFKRIPCSISLIWSWNIYCLRSSWNTVLRWSTTHGTQMVCVSTCENPASRWFTLLFFYPIFARPNEIQTGSISTGASQTNFWGHFGSSSEPAGSINLPQSYFYQHIHLPATRICQPVQWESFFSLHIIFFSSNEPLPVRS